MRITLDAKNYQLISNLIIFFYNQYYNEIRNNLQLSPIFLNYTIIGNLPL